MAIVVPGYGGYFSDFGVGLIFACCLLVSFLVGFVGILLCLVVISLFYVGLFGFADYVWCGLLVFCLGLDVSVLGLGYCWFCCC